MTDNRNFSQSAAGPANPIPPCSLCDHDTGWEADYRVVKDSHREIFGDRYIAICKKCGFGNSLPAISTEELASYYSTDFAPRFRGPVASGKWPILDERSIAQLSIARMFADFRSGDAFLDLGPGAGISFYSASHLLPDPRMYGVEMNEEMIANIDTRIPEVKFAPTVSAIARLIDSPVKIALTSHCLEHFNGEDVIPTLREIHGAIAPGGILMAEVPHWDLRTYDKRKNDVPHLCFYSQDALKTALEKAGFEIELIQTFGIPHGAPKTFESDRRKKFDRDLLESDGGYALMLANSPDNSPRPGGKILRAVARKSFH